MWKKKLYSLEVTTNEGENRKLRTKYSGYKTIRFRYNKRNKTLKATLIRHNGQKKVIEKVNVELVEKYQD